MNCCARKQKDKEKAVKSQVQDEKSFAILETPQDKEQDPVRAELGSYEDAPLLSEEEEEEGELESPLTISAVRRKKDLTGEDELETDKPEEPPQGRTEAELTACVQAVSRAAQEAVAQIAAATEQATRHVSYVDRTLSPQPSDLAVSLSNSPSASPLPQPRTYTIYTRDPCGKEIYPTEDGRGEVAIMFEDEYRYALDEFGNEYYPRDQDGNEYYLHRTLKDGSPGDEFYAIDNGGDQYYAKKSNTLEYYARAADKTELFAVNSNGDEVYVRNLDDIEIYPYDKDGMPRFARDRDGNEMYAYSIDTSREIYPVGKSRDQLYARDAAGRQLYARDGTESDYYAQDALGCGYFCLDEMGKPYYAHDAQDNEIYPRDSSRNLVFLRQTTSEGATEVYARAADGGEYYGKGANGDETYATDPRGNQVYARTAEGLQHYAQLASGAERYAITAQGYEYYCVTAANDEAYALDAQGNEYPAVCRNWCTCPPPVGSTDQSLISGDTHGGQFPVSATHMLTPQRRRSSTQLTIHNAATTLPREGVHPYVRRYARLASGEYVYPRTQFMSQFAITDPNYCSRCTSGLMRISSDAMSGVWYLAADGKCQYPHLEGVEIYGCDVEGNEVYIKDPDGKQRYACGADGIEFYARNAEGKEYPAIDAKGLPHRPCSRSFKRQDGLETIMDCTEYLVPDSYNTRNIPRAAFVEDIGAFVGTFDGDCAACIASLQETLGKYNLMLDALRKQRDGLRASTAELRENLDAISHLQDRFEEASEVDVRYELAAGVYARARIPRTDRISLWLGSGVMVEYPPEEARALLSKNLAEADAAITDLEQNIQFLKEQATTTEVCISRVFNWDVQNRSHGRLPSES